jgi:tRNA threonylcarbamoyladenosine biosynthesis protein TsaB
MKVLGVDTSGKNGSIALVECTADACRTVELVPLEGGTFSAQLVPQIAALLQRHGLTKHQIDAFAVVTGPGSFTGLRVGLAAIKALAEILKKPIAAVSLLEAIALGAQANGRITPVLDAGRGELYVGSYDVQGNSAVCNSEETISTNEFRERAVKQQIVTPDQQIAELLSKGLGTVHSVARPRADIVANIGFRKLKSGETVSPEALDATYIRRSEAEIKLAEQEK